MERAFEVTYDIDDEGHIHINGEGLVDATEFMNELEDTPVKDHTGLGGPVEVGTVTKAEIRDDKLYAEMKIRGLQSRGKT